MASRANFILARAAIADRTSRGGDRPFQKTLATSKEPRLLAWSHIYLGRMLDLDCKRDEAVAEYKEALATRDGAAGHAAGRRARGQDGLCRQGTQLREMRKTIRARTLRRSRTARHRERQNHSNRRSGYARSDCASSKG